MKKQIVAMVRESKYNKQKRVTIPKNCDIKEGDYVIIEKLEKRLK